MYATTVEPVDARAEFENIATVWRKFLVVCFYVFIPYTALPFLIGFFACCGEKMQKVLYPLGCVTCIVFLVKCVLFWWALAIRGSSEGKVAAGKQVKACEDAIYSFDQ